MKDDGLGYLFMFFFCFFINLKVVGGTCGSIANRGQLRDALDGEVCACRSIFVKGQDIEISGKETQAEQHGTCNGCRPWNTITGLNYLYMITEDDGDFDTLRQVCQNCGGDVAIFNTSDTASEIESIMGELGLSDVLSVWIGIKRKTGQRELFEWLDGRTFSTVDSLWDSGQPNDDDMNQDCVTSLITASWHIHDRTCDQIYYMLCQRGR
ncbi:C-type lectin domain family 4 member G-like isoform X2 [Apostichopus japonicus]|uniref:C-type lectin domain family 4 member G-like isoform X2 n=1 Tax=Stichopus japonicus TaxID=307972 RepID=UPI003AB54B5F